MSLTCGGRGPCCHIGYAHRHCEHCDAVIALSVSPHSHWPFQQPYFSYATNGLANQLGNLQALQSSHLAALTEGLSHG